MKNPIRLILAILAGLLFFVTAAFAQEATSMMTDLTGLSVQQQLYATQGIVIFKLLSEFYSCIRNGGGLRRILLSFWLGENLPKAVAQDYEKELSTPPFPPKDN